jgi:hypothetical protein
MRHQTYKRNDGYFSCRVCQWKFETRPGGDNCPGYLRIEHETEDYKTYKQWKSAGYDLIIPEGRISTPIGAVAIVHSTNYVYYYHREYAVKHPTPPPAGFEHIGK